MDGQLICKNRELEQQQQSIKITRRRSKERRKGIHMDRLTETLRLKERITVQLKRKGICLTNSRSITRFYNLFLTNSNGVWRGGVFIKGSLRRNDQRINFSQISLSCVLGLQWKLQLVTVVGSLTIYHQPFLLTPTRKGLVPKKSVINLRTVWRLRVGKKTQLLRIEEGPNDIVLQWNVISFSIHWRTNDPFPFSSSFIKVHSHRQEVKIYIKSIFFPQSL